MTLRVFAFARFAFFACLYAAAHAAEPVKPGAQALLPNLEGRVDQPLRYRPEGLDFVIDNGKEFFNRPLYGGNTAFRVDGGDRPEFSLYLPGRGGNLRLGVRTAAGSKWLHAASAVQMRYRPGELHYEIADELLGPRGGIKVAAIAYAATEGLGLRISASNLPQGAELLIAFGAGNGKRGRRDGDIGTESVPISQYFQFSPGQARASRIEVRAHGFAAVAPHATISATISGAGHHIRPADAAHWDDAAAMLAGAAEGDAAGETQVALARVALGGRPVHVALQVSARGNAGDLDIYRQVSRQASARSAKPETRRQRLLPAFAPAELAQRFADARGHVERIRNRVRIETPDPFIDAAMGALNIAADAVWDEEQGAIMHGAIAWRTKLLGWRGPYALDALGWHERARRNADAWTVRQNTNAIADQLPPPDAASNLARSEAALHSNGDISNSHYDMNLVFIDALLRHLLWTGDLDYARAVWPVLERHLAWERRMFRREFGPDKLPLYEAYAAIWASDDIYYNGGGVAYSSAYNAWHNHMAGRIARLIGKDPAPYEAEAGAIGRAMRAQLWMAERGAFAEYRDLLGNQMAHPSYGLWSFYHTIDSRVPTPVEAARMAADLDGHLKPLPIRGPGVPNDAAYRMLPSSNWMPYAWSVNNVVMGENLHTALAYWQAGRRQTAFELAKGALLASLYMGITPGNIGSMNYLDVYRRESQRDFADGSGVMARTLVEGLFGVQPDALAATLTVRPGLPRTWEHARLAHPDVSLAFRRSGLTEHWTIGQGAARFKRLVVELPALRSQVMGVKVNGKPAAWQALGDSAEEPRLRIETGFARTARIEVKWRGPAIARARATGLENGVLRQYRQGDFQWWQRPAVTKAAATCALEGPRLPGNGAVVSRPVDLSGIFNDRIASIFKTGKYRSPRSPHVSLSLPAQGIGAWAGHVNDMASIDDAGLRALGGTLRLPNGLAFATPAARDAPNVIFTSQWDPYPREATVALTGQARRVFLLMAGSTNWMQSRIDNGEVLLTYQDGTQARMALKNPQNWWPIEQDYFADDYQFALCGPLPLRVDLKTARVRVPDAASFKGSAVARIDGGSATVLEMPADPGRPLRSITVRALAQDVVIGLMGVTLD